MDVGVAEPGRVAIELAVVDARPADASETDSLLAVEARDGSALSLARSLGRLPAYALIARRYRRQAELTGGRRRFGDCASHASGRRRGPATRTRTA